MSSQIREVLWLGMGSASCKTGANNPRRQQTTSISRAKLLCDIGRLSRSWTSNSRQAYLQGHMSRSNPQRSHLRVLSRSIGKILGTKHPRSPNKFTSHGYNRCAALGLDLCSFSSSAGKTLWLVRQHEGMARQGCNIR